MCHPVVARRTLARTFAAVGSVARSLSWSRLHARIVAISLLWDPLGTLLRLATGGRRIISLRVGWQRVVFLHDPADVRSALVDQRATLAKGDTLDGLRLVLGSNVITADGADHAHQRRALAPAFSARRRDEWAAVVADVAEQRLDRWHAGDVRPIEQEMLDLTLIVAGRALFGHDLTPQARVFGDALRQLSDLSGLASLPFAESLARTPLPVARRFREARAVLREAVDPIVDSIPNAKPDSVLAAVAEAASTKPVSERRTMMRDQVLALLVAGHVTSGNALAWATYLISSDRAVEERLAREAAAVAPDRRLRGDDLEQLPCARAVFAEALRLYPPAWAIGRRAMSDVSIDGTVIPRGAIVVASPWLSHRDNRHHLRADDFDPSRWQDGARTSDVFYPFGMGPRRCLGETLAWVEGTLVLAAIARRWRVRIARPLPVEPRPEITLSPRGGLPMRILLARALPSAPPGRLVRSAAGGPRR
jgi:cytochrome P450